MGLACRTERQRSRFAGGGWHCRQGREVVPADPEHWQRQQLPTQRVNSVQLQRGCLLGSTSGIIEVRERTVAPKDRSRQGGGGENENRDSSTLLHSAFHSWGGRPATNGFGVETMSGFLNTSAN